MEGELTSTAEALPHLKSHGVLVSGSNKALNLDHIFLRGGVNNADVPVALLEEVVVLGANVAGANVLWKVVVLEFNFECDNIDSCNDFLAFALSGCCDRNDRQRLDNLLKFGQLGLVTVEETEFSALLRRQSAEGSNLAVGNLMSLQLFLVLLDLSGREVRKLLEVISISPETLREVLLELDDGGDGLPADLLL